MALTPSQSLSYFHPLVFASHFLPRLLSLFVSHSYNLIFYEVPRTGSRSISHALASLDPRSPTAVVRALKRNLYHYHVFDNTLIERHPDYALVAVHRNPFDRIRSHFKYRKQYGNPDELKQFSFSDYVNWVCEGKLPFEIGPAMIDKPITELLPCDRVDHFLDFENLAEGWNSLGTALDIKLPSLSNINNSSDIYNEQSEYTPELTGKIVKRFAADFECFGYSTVV